MYYIYTVLNKQNGKIYVGKTKNYRKRVNQHLSAARRGGAGSFYLHRAINKYGVDNFTFNILQSFENEEDCFSAEKYWISYFGSSDSDLGYNLTIGGEGATGSKRSEETKQKLRNSKLGKKRSEEDKAKISLGRMGIIFSESHKNAMSKSRQNKYVGKDNNFYGKTHLPENIQKFSGEKNGLAKLNDQKVREIMDKFDSGVFTKQLLADEYDVSRNTIHAIIVGKTWKHISRKTNDE